MVHPYNIKVFDRIFIFECTKLRNILNIVNLHQGMCIECKPCIVVGDNHQVDLGPNQTIEQWCWRAPISILRDVPHCVRSAIQNGMN